MEDFYSAASRHWDNSSFLTKHQCYQEAAYIAGYAAECALKGLVEKGGLIGRHFGHNLFNLSGDGLELALVLNPLLTRYHVDFTIPQWKETDRYEKTNFLSEQAFKNTIAKAHEITDLILVGLVLDGLLEDMPE